MYSNDTICALATAPGIAGLAVVRISGPEAFSIVDRIFSAKTKISNASSHSIVYGTIDLVDEVRDTVTVSVFRAPHSYTGEDVAEIGCHGGSIIPDLVVKTLLLKGARAAGAGEFTQRSFLNGKLDLTQVESVADIIHSSSTASARVSSKQLFGRFRDTVSLLRSELINICALLELELDFSQEDIELVKRDRIETALQESILGCERFLNSFSGSASLRSGFKVTLVGKPNAGKSMLFNELLNTRRAIVHEEAGTTRDYIQESVLWGGVRITLIDTAGLRLTSDVVEEEGVKLTDSIVSESNLVLLVNDSTDGALNSLEIENDLHSKYRELDVLLLQNKIDLIQDYSQDLSIAKQLSISVKERVGIDNLKQEIISRAKAASSLSSEVLLNQRHYQLLNNASMALNLALLSFKGHQYAELVAFEIRKAIDALGELTGESFNEEVLNAVFKNFCIGK